MTPKDTARLLIVTPSQNDAEQLISILRNAGIPTRAQHIVDSESLDNALNKQRWDVMVLDQHTDAIDVSTVLHQVRRQNLDLPIILQGENGSDEQRLDAIKMGAKDWVSSDSDELLLAIIQRELSNLRTRQELNLSEDRIRESEKRCQLLLDSSMDAIAYVTDGMHIYTNQAYAERFGFEDLDELACIPIVDLIAEQDQERFRQFLKKYGNGQDQTSEELQLSGCKENGETFDGHVIFSPARYDDEPCIQVLIRAKQDTSPELEKQLESISQRDTATGLFNRSHMLEQLSGAIEEKKLGAKDSAVLYLAIDNFEQIRSDSGLKQADAVLMDIAQVLQQQTDDSQLVAKFVDGSYMILLPDTPLDNAANWAQKLHEHLDDHICDTDGQTIQVTSSIGISAINYDSDSAENVIQQAMEAYHQSCKQRQAVTSYTSIQHKHAGDDDKQTVSSIERALADNRFKLLFQPIISLRGSADETYEVLLRMIDDSGEEVTPQNFIESATDAILSTKLDRWVILESIKVLAKHRVKGHNTRLMVNLSANSLQDQTLLPWLAVAFKAAKLPSESVIFQLNESDVTSYVKQAKEFTRQLAEMNCVCAITQFGCSLKPFQTLKHLTNDYVKLDGSFTLGIQNGKEDASNLAKMIQELHAEGKQTIVPFVENASILSTLWQAGANYIQGHYLQAPSTSMDYDFSTDE